MRKLAIIASLLTAAVLTIAAAVALADRGNGGGGNNFRTNLSGYNEVPSQSTPGTGTFRARIVGGDEIHYRLHYEGFEAAETSTVGAHIHFGQPGVVGGVSAHICGGGGGSPPCTFPEGTFEGVFDSADVVALPGQGIAAGEMAELLRAMRHGFTYVNVHTTRAPGGLIRGQLKRGHGGGGGGNSKSRK